MRLKVINRRRFRNAATTFGLILLAIPSGRAWVFDREIALDLDSFLLGSSMTIVMALLATSEVGS